jgi:hypothetical protein
MEGYDHEGHGKRLAIEPTSPMTSRPASWQYFNHVQYLVEYEYNAMES